MDLCVGVPAFLPFRVEFANPWSAIKRNFFFWHLLVLNLLSPVQLIPRVISEVTHPTDRASLFLLHSACFRFHLIESLESREYHWKTWPAQCGKT